MKATIAGLERVSYTKKDGTDVDAHIIHLTRNDRNVSGTCCEQVYLSTEQLKNLGFDLHKKDYDALVGVPVTVEYNAKGFVAAFELDE